MPETSLAPPSPTQVVLSLEEWNEIQDSVIALHASIYVLSSDSGIRPFSLRAVLIICFLRIFR